MRRECYSHGINEFYEPRRLSIHDFKLDENGFVKTGDTPLSGNYESMKDRLIRYGIPTTFETFSLGKINSRKQIWFMFGYRVVIERYDTNILIEIQNRITDIGYCKEDVYSYFEDSATKNGYGYSIIGDNEFISITDNLATA